MMRCVRLPALIALITLSAVAALIGQTAVFSLPPGQYAVGFKTIDLYDYTRAYRTPISATGEAERHERARPIQTSIWYPAAKTSATPMRYGDYFELGAHQDGPPTAAQVAKFLDDYERLWREEEGIPKERWDVIRQTPVRAVRGAAPASGKFPVVVYSAGGGQPSWDNSVLFEYLASHGYVVIASPSTWDWERNRTAVGYESVEAAARDIEFHIAFARTLPYVDSTRLALMGYSWGGLASPIVALRNSGVSAVVGLDGSVTWANEYLAKATHRDPAGLRAAFFEFHSSAERFAQNAELHGHAVDAKTRQMLKDLELSFPFYEGIRYTDAFNATMLRSHHGNFASHFIILTGDRKPAEPTMAEDQEGYGVLARYTLAFLNSYVNGDSDARAWLRRSPADNGIRDGIIRVVSKMASPNPPPTIEGFARFVRDNGFDRLVALVDSVRRTDSTYGLSEETMNRWADQLDEVQRKDLSLAVREWIKTVYPAPPAPVQPPSPVPEAKTEQKAPPPAAAQEAARRPALLPTRTMIGLANTVSGARPLAVLNEIAGVERDRPAEEYAGTYRESEIIAQKAREYGFSDVQILRYPLPKSVMSERLPGKEWDGTVGQLWVTSPVEKKIVDYEDVALALAPGSVTGTYEGELVWIEKASDPAAYTGMDVRGKIVLTAAKDAGGRRPSTQAGFAEAVRHGALGVVNMAVRRPYQLPRAIEWSEIGRPTAGFAFNVSAPMMEDLRLLLFRGPVRVKAVVEAAWRDADTEVVTAVIPGDGSTNEWVALSAHLFEGVTKQGASDDGSGSVLILEAGRTMIEAMAKGYVRRPARSMRFVWVDEITGSHAFLEAHRAEAERMVAHLDIDMAGQNMTLNANSLQMIRMPDSRIHYQADVAASFLEWIFLNNYERMSSLYFDRVLIEDPMGSRDGFAYAVETFVMGSDHVVFMDRGVPAIFFHTWPDPVYHTTHDRPERMDATQMKRIAFIAAATSLVTAGSPDVSPAEVAAEAAERGRQRIADDLRRWERRLATAAPDSRTAVYADLQAAMKLWFLREARNIRTVGELMRGSTSRDRARETDVIETLAAALEGEAAARAETVSQLYRKLGGALPLPPQRPEEEAAARIVPLPRDRLLIQGYELPVEAPASLRGFVPLEILWFIDGKRSALDLRDSVNAEFGAEYGSVPLAGVTEYLKSLEAAGVLRLTTRR